MLYRLEQGARHCGSVYVQRPAAVSPGGHAAAPRPAAFSSQSSCCWSWSGSSWVHPGSPLIPVTSHQLFLLTVDQIQGDLRSHSEGTVFSASSQDDVQSLLQIDPSCACTNMTFLGSVLCIGKRGYPNATSRSEAKLVIIIFVRPAAFSSSRWTESPADQDWTLSRPCASYCWCHSP